MNPIHRESIYSEDVDVDLPADTVDLDHLRRALVGPFDRAAHAVQIAGYEQDDAVIERELLCRIDEVETVRIPVGPLADGDAFAAHLLRVAASKVDHPVAIKQVRIIGLCVEAILERWAQA